MGIVALLIATVGVLIEACLSAAVFGSVFPDSVFGHGPVICCCHVFAAYPDCVFFFQLPVAGFFGNRISLLRACIIAVAIVLIALVADSKVCFCMCPGFCFHDF